MLLTQTGWCGAAQVHRWGGIAAGELFCCRTLCVGQSYQPIGRLWPADKRPNPTAPLKERTRRDATEEVLPERNSGIATQQPRVYPAANAHGAE